jgi:inosine-uridine nucleoside N-ribohydrolase
MTLYHLDTDMGVDDGLALVLAHRLLPGQLAVSTVFGNVPVSVATRNAMLFRELLHQTATLSVFAGADRASDGFTRDARHIHGEDGLGGATHSLDRSLLETISNQRVVRLDDASPPKGSPVVLIGIGPATNIPRLVSWYGRSAISRIVLMSGTFFDFGNITRAAEFNAYCDPFALRETLDLAIPTMLVPLDVCRKVKLSRGEMAAFKETDKSPLTNLLVTSHLHYMDAYTEWEGLDGCFPHDSVTVLAALKPELLFTLRGQVLVECAPAERGRTTFKPTVSSHVEVVTGGELKWAREILASFLKGALPRSGSGSDAVPTGET